MSSIGATELIILLVVVLVLFGAKRLPDSARALGRSMRILKAETRGLRDDSDTTVTAEPLPPSPPSAAQAERPAGSVETGEQQAPPSRP